MGRWRLPFWKPMGERARTAFAFGTLFLVASCASTPPPTPITETIALAREQVCAAWPYVSYSSSQDSARTIIEAQANNIARVTTCEQEPTP